MYAYVAGPLYNEGERWFDEVLARCAEEVGISTYLPHRDLGLLAGQKDSPRLFAGDMKQLDRAEIVVANLDGISIDSGAAWELGYAYARGKHLIGIRTDFRTHARHSDLNPMILHSLNKLVNSVEDLRAYLEKYASSNPKTS